MKIKPFENLKPYPKNANKHTPESVAGLASAIQKWGFAGAVVVRGGFIASGHGSIMAVRKILEAGERVYPVPGKACGAKPFPDGHLPIQDATGWTDEDFRAYVIAHNQHGVPDWDEELLALELGDLKEVNFDFELVGFDQSQVDEILGGGEEEKESDTEVDVDEMGLTNTCPKCGFEYD